MENKHKMSENRSKKYTQGDGNLSQGDPQSQKHGGAALQTER